MVGKDLLVELLQAAEMRRWNDKLCPVPLTELDKQGHKMTIAYVLGKFAEREGGFSWTEVIEGGLLSDSRIMVKKKHNEDKKLHNFDEKLHNSVEPDLTWQEAVDLAPEDEVEGGSEIYYYTDEDGNIHSREFVERELIPDESDVEGLQKGKSTGKLQKLKPGAVDIISLRAGGHYRKQGG